MKKLTIIILTTLFFSCNKHKSIVDQNSIQTKVYHDILPMFLACNFLNIFPPPQNIQTEEIYKNGPIYIVINDTTETISEEDKNAFLNNFETNFHPSESWFKNGNQKVVLNLTNSKFKIINTVEFKKLLPQEEIFCGKIQLSNVAFDSKKQYAILSIIYSCCKNGNCGNGYRVYLKYEDSKYIIKKVVNSWKS